MRLALSQVTPPGPDPDATLAQVAAMLAEAAGQGAEMLLLPELLLPGYNRPELIRATAQPFEGPWITALRQLARDAGCGVTLGWAERAGPEETGAQIYNAATCIDAGGAILGHYRKLQLYGEMEQAVFAPGDAHVTFDLAGQRCGLLICYDVEFPEQVRAMADLGVTLLLVPTANPAGFDHVQDRLIPARAAENGMTVAYANFTGDDHGLRFGGGSVIAGPEGEPLARAGAAPALLLADVSPRDPGLATRSADLRLPRA